MNCVTTIRLKADSVILERLEAVMKTPEFTRFVAGAEYSETDVAGQHLWTSTRWLFPLTDDRSHKDLASSARDGSIFLVRTPLDYFSSIFPYFSTAEIRCFHPGWLLFLVSQAGEDAVELIQGVVADRELAPAFGRMLDVHRLAQ